MKAVYATYELGPLVGVRPMLGRWFDEVERYLIERTLAAQGGNASEAARALGLSRSPIPTIRRPSARITRSRSAAAPRR